MMLTKLLPDVISEQQPEHISSLKWVGMEKISIPIKIRTTQRSYQLIQSKADVYISLDSPNTKGIHMSRLYFAINKLAGVELNKKVIDDILEEIIQNQRGIGSEAKFKLNFQLMLNKPALLSNKSGYQSYPVVITAHKNKKGLFLNFELTVVYSSTCPCSASLSKQLQANAIDEAFSNSQIDKSELIGWIQSKEGLAATPHSQRSYATIKFSTDNNDLPDLESFIFHIEEVIGTPVQTAVKREDEQEFAKMNAKNLLFCEDAARRLKLGLDSTGFIKDYWFKVEHHESLHSHNAVVVDHSENYFTSFT